MTAGSASQQARRGGLVRQVRLVSHARDWRGRSRTPRSAEPWSQPIEEKEFPTAWARTSPARLARSAIRRGVLQPIVRSQTKVEVHGAGLVANITGPVIIVANHSSHLDTPLILGALPPQLTRRTAVGAAADYFFDARWRASMTALVFGAFPIERLGKRRTRNIAPRLIAEGWSVLIFPEGTRSPDGWMRNFRLGAASLAVQNKIPVVPVAIRGAYAAMPRGRNWVRPGRPRVAVHIGRPIVPRAGETAPAVSNRLYDAVRTLWAEEELGWWGAQSAAGSGDLPVTTGPQGAAWRRVWGSTRPLPSHRRGGTVWRR
ncbi:MAG: lysophospholipid acyltransferase family protein [Mycobacteriales bacterium]